MDTRVVVLATSLSAESRSQVLARHAYDRLSERGVDAALVDVRRLELPPDGTGADWARLRQEVHAATHVLFAVPIYNFGVNAQAKALVEQLPDDHLDGKTVGFLCAAGGQRAYTSVLPFANALMLDFRCWIVPRFVYATGDDIKNGTVVNPDIHERVEVLINDLLGRAPA